jgi:hypothetical protein
MTIHEFWNHAFLAALARCPAEDARDEADRALQLCIRHWHLERQHWSGVQSLWQDQDVRAVFHPVTAQGV